MLAAVRNATTQPHVEISPIRPTRSRSAKVDKQKKAGKANNIFAQFYSRR